MEVILVKYILTTLIVHSLAAEKDGYNCGPRELCKCFEDSSTTDTTCITMDCSGKKTLGNLTEICENLGNATCLEANSNDITGTISEVSVRGCENLTYLSLRENKISNITQGAFNKLHNLEVLNISKNSLSLYTGELDLIFTGLVNLKTLKMNGNVVDSAKTPQQYPDLTGNKNLTTLFIDGLQNNASLFPSLVNLVVLNVSGFDGTCDIRRIDDISFASLSLLQRLDLSHCKLVNISHDAFTPLRSLKWLDISHNRQLGFRPMFNISHGLQYTNIAFMNYSYVYNTFGLGTQITKADLCFLYNTTLREIALNGNRIQFIETNALQLLPPNLTVIHVNDNKFTFGPYLLQLACLKNTEEVYAGFQNLAHNPSRYSSEAHSPSPPPPPPPHCNCSCLNDTFVNEISKGIGHCPFYKKGEPIILYPNFPKHLRKFIFNDSFMKYSLPNVTLPTGSIEHLDVSGNVLYDWEGPVGVFSNLTYLDLSRNYCAKMGRHFFKNIRALENLQIHSNFIGLSPNITDMADIFLNMTSLRTMNLSINKITSLHPKSFEGLVNLETLDLGYNSIERWEFEVDSLSSLSHVNLSNNALQSLPLTLLQHLQEVARHHNTTFTVNLQSNSLRYGCQTKDFLSWMVDHKKSFVGFNEYVFVDDNGDPVTADIEIKVKELEKKCQSNVVWIVISCIGVSVAFSVIIFGLVYRNRWKLRYFMYMSKQRFYGYVRVPNEEPVENYKYDAFISYSEENLRFVKDQLIPRIEHNGVSLCVHQRDFLPGNAIADNIVDAIQSSRKTVVLLTKAFLKSKWCMYEFNMARMENIYSRDGRGCLVLVMLENVAAGDMPAELLDWVRRESYLEYTADEPAGEQLFWGSLADAIKP